MGTRKALRSNRRRAAGLAWPGSTRYRVTTKGGVHGHGGYHDEVPADPRPLVQNLSPISIDLPTLTLALTASGTNSMDVSRITQLRFLRYLNLRGTNLSTVSDWSLVTNITLRVNISSKWRPPFRVQHAHFSTCQMGPQFPAWIQWQVDIVRLYISSAGINDSIPHWFANNAISGSLPRDLSNLKSLRQKYPTAFCSHDYDVEGYSSSLTTVLKGQQLNYGFIVKIIGIDLNIIDLSLNNLTGEIPEEIATLGVLVNLNLSRNHFSCNIRSGAMQSLVSLDLSRNELSGEIPESLSITGRIPSSPQLISLYDQNPFIYTGNIGLCSPPLQKNCSSTHPTKQGPGVELFYIGLGCGFIVGIWVTFFALLFKKRWRIAFFSLLDKLYDKAYVLVVVTWARLTRKTTAT
uniref:Leucine-rich repeat-containing N-terminal plant-type domain-containing protein n=1 Tax=Setaria viridis TaxID=4556 RepID=A0A4U6TU78_SETVI|nr:hypothetical protein SEVIR_8G166600v2 [Setaria viridis]